MIMPAEKIDISASNVNRQRRIDVAGIPTHQTMGELLDGVLVPRLQLPRFDSEGRNVNYSARIERSGLKFQRSGLIADALQPGDHVVVQPEVQAGAR